MPQQVAPVNGALREDGRLLRLQVHRRGEVPDLHKAISVAGDDELAVASVVLVHDAHCTGRRAVHRAEGANLLPIGGVENVQSSGRAGAGHLHQHLLLTLALVAVRAGAQFGGNERCGEGGGSF